MGRKNRIIIIGPGRMGLGIALSFALKNARVSIVDAKERSVDECEKVRRNAEKELSSNLKFLRKVGYVKGDLRKILSKISFCYGINGENLEGDFIFEAIPEKPDLKIDLFRKISPLVHRETILASATSTINIKTLQRGFIHPNRLLITHWLNPAFIIPLVEIACSDRTDRRSIEQIKELLKEDRKGACRLAR